ncbi:MFS transporter [Alicyclobacillus fastidiosus]|uniref:MFS transporter n=1 Tax=Alicyclobacillus fastidiosus TaxID=392011 RepID=A0ABV5AB43_9BACL|nr:MFS transporter [Alicyclobacillus fastidiosus]WEH10545.1 MFS transporter [Alicyclobacillus fastidiosus]
MSERELFPTRKSIFSNRRFLALLSGQGISYFGDAIASVALPILILSVTGSGFVMGLVGALELAPLFVVGLPAGVWVDRWNRRTVMLFADFGRAVFMGIIPVATLMHIKLMPVVFTVAIASGILSVFFGAAYTGMIPRIVAPDELGPANGYFEAVESAAYALGPAIAGVLTAKIGPSWTLGLDACSFLVSAISILSLRAYQRKRTDSSAVSRDFFAEMRVGFQTVFNDPVLKTITLLWGGNRFVFAALIPTLTFFILKTLHGSPEQVGIAVSLYAVGSLVGTLVASKIPERDGMATAFCAQGMMAVGSTLIATTQWIPMAFMSAAILGLGEGMVLVIYLTYRVSRVSEQVVGRVYTITSTATQGMGALGYIIVGSLLSIWGGHITWIISSTLSILGILSSFVVWKGPFVVRKDVP